MADGIEERKEKEARIAREKLMDRGDRVELEDAEDWGAPEREAS